MEVSLMRRSDEGIIGVVEQGDTPEWLVIMFRPGIPDRYEKGIRVAAEHGRQLLARHCVDLARSLNRRLEVDVRELAPGHPEKGMEASSCKRESASVFV